jgi:hypothetical protein
LVLRRNILLQKLFKIRFWTISFLGFIALKSTVFWEKYCFLKNELFMPLCMTSEGEKCPRKKALHIEVASYRWSDTGWRLCHNSSG